MRSLGELTRWRVEEKHSAKHPDPDILKWFPCSAATARSWLCVFLFTQTTFSGQNYIPTTALLY